MNGIAAPQSKGFTLIELMITVAIIAVLASIAYPSYQEQIAKSRRNEATNTLMVAAQALERYYSANGRYTTERGGDELPAVFPVRVPENGSVYYEISADGPATANTYTLVATRRGVMTGDRCGDYSLSHTGEVALKNQASEAAATLAQCWRR